MTKKKQELSRGAGVLMPISALPSPYGIGTLGRESYRFADFLEEISCTYWQILPVGPTSFGDSPYQSYSAFAGNPYFIDLDVLVEEGLLKEGEITGYPWQKEEDSIAYERVNRYRFPILEKAFHRSSHRNTEEFQEFCQSNAYWLEDYGLYMAVKSHFYNRHWQQWDEDIRLRRKEAIDTYTARLAEEIELWKFIQYKFFEQWNKLKAYVNGKGIRIIGDIPLYVAGDSSDVWVHSELFELDERKNPTHVAGVPPDLFSKKGQRWGNPLYRWDVMEQSDYAWWRERMKASAKLYDVIRIDHFIGIVNYYSIPADSITANVGRWKKGPGKKLTDAIAQSVGDAKIIAEDLGTVSPKVRKLMEQMGFPGMKVLEFGMEGPEDNEYLPHNFKDTNVVAYTGTHDNETLVGFLRSKLEKNLEFAYRYFQVKSREELPYAIIRALYASIADVVIIPMQDLLELDNRARMNYPSTIGGNWKWRMRKNQYAELNIDRLKEFALLYARAPK
jgi:4-alpha-glucanotransferase